MAEPLSFTEFRKSLLAITYRSLEDGFDRLCVPEEAAEAAGLVGKPGWVARALDQFETNGWARVHRLLNGPASVQLTGDGIEAAEELIDEGWDQIEGAPKAPGGDPAVTAVAPASDRVVSLDHNAAGYKEAVAALDAIVERLRGDNELAARNPLEHGQRSAELVAGRAILDAPQASTNAVQWTLVAALSWFAVQFAGTTVQPFIEGALATLGQLFGVSWWAP